jgi:hypothetical protein
VIYSQQAQQREISCIIEWHVRPSQTIPPAFVAELAHHARIAKFQWQPQGITFSKNAESTGSPTPISDPP